MQVCTLLQTDNHASTPPLSFLQAGCPSYRPTNSVNALKALYRLTCIMAVKRWLLLCVVLCLHCPSYALPEALFSAVHLSICECMPVPIVRIPWLACRRFLFNISVCVCTVLPGIIKTHTGCHCLLGQSYGKSGVWYILRRWGWRVDTVCWQY